MKKLESNLLNMFLVLSLVAVISGAALAATWNVTSPILAEQARQRQIDAIAAVAPPFDNEPLAEAIDVDDARVFPARSGSSVVGAAVASETGSGYGGPISVMVGFDASGAVTGVSVLAHTETPGLGARITEGAFLQQFVGARPGGEPLAVIKDGGAVDAITAATISSRAVCDAINAAADAWTASEGAM